MKRAILFLFILLLIPQAYAIGISPSMIKMDFQPGYEETFYFTVSGVASSKVIIHGSLGQYITVSDSVLKNKNSFAVTIKLPEKMDTPGINKGFIEVVEMRETQEGMVAGVAAIEAPIYVRVPYPGIYTEVGFVVADVNVNETAHFYVEIKNLGTLNITRAFADIEVKDAENRTTARLKTNEKPVLAGSREELAAEMATIGYKPGAYMAYAEISYDMEKKYLSDAFRIGGLTIKIRNHTRQFLQNTINRFDVDIESGWNNKIRDLYAEIQVKNSTKVIAEMKTPLADLEPWETAKLTAYWDTKNVNIGAYSAVASLYYEGKSDTHNLEVFVVKPKELEKPGILSSSMAAALLLVLLALLIIADIIWVVKRNKGRKKGALKSTKKRP